MVKNGVETWGLLFCPGPVFSGVSYAAMDPSGHESESKQALEARLRATLGVIPVHASCANPSAAVTDLSNEENFPLIVETIPALIAVMTCEGAVAHVNRRVLDYFGRTLEELKEWGTTDAVHPAELPSVVAAWQHAVEAGPPYEVEHRLRRADGEYRWFQSRALPSRDANGRIVRWYNLLTDIHVRKQSEETLRHSET